MLILLRNRSQFKEKAFINDYGFLVDKMKTRKFEIILYYPILLF
jgi:hypothetical protein